MTLRTAAAEFEVHRLLSVLRLAIAATAHQRVGTGDHRTLSMIRRSESETFARHLILDSVKRGPDMDFFESDHLVMRADACAFGDVMLKRRGETSERSTGRCQATQT